MERGAYLARRAGVIGGIHRLLVEELRANVTLEALDLDAPLFGSGLALDSIDALELAVLLEERFGVRLPEAGRRDMFRSVNTLADAVLACRGEGP